jgi:transcriptional regulator GlxA family with amidase domain
MCGEFDPVCLDDDTFRYQEIDSLRKVEQSIAYMQQNMGKPLQVATLAALVNVSPSHFFTLFKQHTGSSPIDYFIRLRMSHAGRLLKSTTARVKEIAAALGYDDQFYFSRLFKAIHNLPPSKYREQKASQGYLQKPVVDVTPIAA